jgi:hypothetical protein
MRMLLTFPNDRRVEGLMLACTRDQIRVVIPGPGDTITLSLEEGVWRTDRGVPVEIEALTALEGIDLGEALAGLAPRTMGAGF